MCTAKPIWCPPAMWHHASSEHQLSSQYLWLAVAPTNIHQRAAQTANKTATLYQGATSAVHMQHWQLLSHCSKFHHNPLQHTLLALKLPHSKCMVCFTGVPPSPTAAAAAATTAPEYLTSCQYHKYLVLGAVTAALRHEFSCGLYRTGLWHRETKLTAQHNKNSVAQPF